MASTMIRPAPSTTGLQEADEDLWVSVSRSISEGPPSGTEPGRSLRCELIHNGAVPVCGWRLAGASKVLPHMFKTLWPSTLVMHALRRRRNALKALAFEPASPQDPDSAKSFGIQSKLRLTRLENDFLRKQNIVLQIESQECCGRSV